jgi:hypothetical protein
MIIKDYYNIFVVGSMAFLKLSWYQSNFTMSTSFLERRMFIMEQY